MLLTHPFEHQRQLIGSFFRQYLHQANMSTFVEDNTQDPLLLDQRDKNILADALLKEHAKILLAQELGNLSRRGKSTGNKRPKSSNVLPITITLRGNHLPTFVKQQHMVSAGILNQTREAILDLPDLLGRDDLAGKLWIHR